MNLDKARENYYFYSGKTSDIVRQLGLGAIAIIWLFRTNESGIVAVPAALVVPLILVVASLACDLLQYAIAAMLWSYFAWSKERAGISESNTFKAPESINWPTILFFYAKVLLVIMAYWSIFKFLSRTISVGV